MHRPALLLLAVLAAICLMGCPTPYYDDDDSGPPPAELTQLDDALITFTYHDELGWLCDINYLFNTNLLESAVTAGLMQDADLNVAWGAYLNDDSLCFMTGDIDRDWWVEEFGSYSLEVFALVGTAAYAAGNGTWDYHGVAESVTDESFEVTTIAAQDSTTTVYLSVSAWW